MCGDFFTLSNLGGEEMAKTKVIKGYICRSKNSDKVLISTGSKAPSLKKETGWFWCVPGWFYKLSTRKFKRMFGFSIRPGTYEPIEISISQTKIRKQLTSLEQELLKN